VCPYLHHIRFYGYRSAVLSEISQLKPTELEQVELLEQLRWLYYGYSIKVIETDIETPNIDVPEDVIKVLAFL
jgi:3-deoxy-manno-octulosonate cytidylyltransferase (CMP-KDO synthetase)